MALKIKRRPGERVFAVLADGQIIKFEVDHSRHPGSTQIAVGIEAPPEVELYREEVYERIQKERELATELG